MTVTAMIASLKRIATALLVAIPLVAVITGLLLLLPSWCALVVGIAGIGLFKAGGHLERLLMTGIGGAMAIGGVLAWALLQTKVV